ncbi:MAG: Hsp20/alpha crystallin family protein [Chitinophagales bacterium]
METKSLTKANETRPSLFDSRGWLDKFINSPLEDYFNFSRVLNVPAVNVNETDDQYFLSFASPGLEKKDIQVQVEDDMLTISAQKEEKEEKIGKYNRREYNYSSWTRSFTLPDDADESKIKAEYKNGELKVEIPRSEKKVRSNVKTINLS